jgi:hypothetical protein
MLCIFQNQSAPVGGASAGRGPLGEGLFLLISGISGDGGFMLLLPEARNLRVQKGQASTKGRGKAPSGRGW